MTVSWDTLDKVHKVQTNGNPQFLTVTFEDKSTHICDLGAFLHAQNQRINRVVLALTNAGFDIRSPYEMGLGAFPMREQADILRTAAGMLPEPEKAGAVYGRDFVALGPHNTRALACTCSQETFQRMAAGNTAHMIGDQHDDTCPMYRGGRDG